MKDGVAHPYAAAESGLLLGVRVLGVGPVDGFGWVGGLGGRAQAEAPALRGVALRWLPAAALAAVVQDILAEGRDGRRAAAVVGVVADLVSAPGGREGHRVVGDGVCEKGEKNCEDRGPHY